MDKGLRSLDLRVASSGRAKHERLRDHFVNELIAGRLKPGQAIPSEAHLVESLGVARMTIRQAMGSLESEGLIRRVQGKGTFIEDDAQLKLRRGQDIFALVVPETRGGYYPSLLHGFEAAAGDIHYQTLICGTNDDVGQQGNVILQLLDKKVGGVAINPSSLWTTPAFQVRQIQERGIPVVFCHRRVEGISAPLLAIPFYEAGRLAGKVLAERGHQRAMFFSYQPSAATQAMEEGFREGLRARGGDVSVYVVYTGGDSISATEEMVWKGLQGAFAGSDPPTAIYTTFDPLAEMTYLLMPELGLRVPQDVSLVGFGGNWREGALARRLTSVVVDEVATGQKAVSLLHEMRHGERPIDDNEEFVLQLSLSDGKTLDAPASKIHGACNGKT